MSKQPTSYLPASSEVELSRWVKQLQEAESRLRDLLGDKVDTVLDADGQRFLLRKAQQKLVASEEIARRSEAMLSEAQRVAHFGSWELDLINLDDIDNNPLRWSDEVFRIFGYKPGEIEISTKNFFRAVHPEDRESVSAAGSRAVRENTSFKLDHRIVLPDGSIRFVHAEAEVFKDPQSGRPLKMIGIVQDITERKEKEEALRLSEEQFSSAFEYGTIGMALVAPDGRWLKVNRALCNLTGYTEEELYQKTFQDITHPDDLKTDLGQVHRVLAGEIHYYQMEKRYFHKLGHVVWIHLGVSLVRDSHGEPLHFVSQIQDITERKSSELRLKRLNRLYSVLSKINETIVRASDEKALCQKACEIAVEHGQMLLAWVGEVDPHTKMIVPFASAGADHGYLENLKLSAEEGPLGNGPAGRAIRQNKPQVSDDIATDRELAYRETALKHGYRSIATIPLSLGPNSRGLMVFYGPESHFFNEDELGLLVSMSENIAFGLEAIRKEHFREEAEAALRESEGHYRLLFYDNPHPMWVYDLETLKFLAVNSTAQSLYGYTPDKFLAMTARDIRPPGDQAQFDELLNTTLQSGKNQMVSRHCNSHGDIINVEISSDAITFNGRTARLVAATNVTEKKAFEKKLAEQADLIDQARDAIILCDMDSRVLFWNKGAERLYGWSASEIAGKKSTELFYGNRDKFALATKVTLDKGAWSGEMEQTTRGKNLVTVESRWTLLRDEKGLPKAVLSINSDITERKKIESHFLRAQRMESIGTLAGGIAHDLNNLLSPIIMGVDLLKHFGIEGPARKVIDDIERSAKRGSNLVKQVLSFARGVEGARVAVKIKDVVSEIESIIHNTFPKDITLEIKNSCDTLMVEGDPTQLHQILLNLCVNARDSMPHGGRITMVIDALMIDEQYESMHRGINAGRYVCLEVTDTGCGIPDENIDKIFDPFFTTKELAKGTGLGLATTLGIVRSHGGFLNVYSELGAGTTFKIYLPARGEDAKADAEQAVEDDWPRGNGECILLVDDELSILTVTRQILEAFGYQVLTAEHGAQAIALYATNRDRIALVLTDMMMPVMDGPATIAALRQVDPNIRIIGASGLNSNTNAAKAAQIAVRHFLAKPYTTGTLLSTIKTALAEEN